MRDDEVWSDLDRSVQLSVREVTDSNESRSNYAGESDSDLSVGISRVGNSNASTQYGSDAISQRDVCAIKMEATESEKSDSDSVGSNSYMMDNN